MKKDSILNFFIKTLNGMAFGLFATLIIGTIIGTIGSYIPEGIIKSSLIDLATLLKNSTGIGIGIGIALALKFDGLKAIMVAISGGVAAYFSLSTGYVSSGVIFNKFQIGDPLTIYLTVILVGLFVNYVLRKKTPVDIILIPLVTSLLSLVIVLLLRVPLIYVTYGIQKVISVATTSQPFLMGVIISALMGMALTAPISSAAIAAVIFTGSSEGLLIASGAAVVGCSTQMIGFAIQSRKDNNIGMVISIAIGTSMLQFKNILKKPIIWLPTIIASMILGPISTLVFKGVCMGANAGMGTAGLVGQIGTISSMGSNLNSILFIVILQFIAPMVLVYVIDLIFRKFNLIKEGDLKV